MRIVHLWQAATAAKGAGGAVAMNRLHLQLRKHGVDSSLICNVNAENSENIDLIVPARTRWESRLKKYTELAGFNDFHIYNASRIKALPSFRAADVVTIHGTHGFINYLSLPKLTEGKPVVFVMHDIWPLTGHCAVSYDCTRWQQGCKPCKYLDAPPMIRRDTAHIEYRLKKKMYSRLNVTFVSPSSIVTRQAELGMLSDQRVVTIPHGLDTQIFYPRNKLEARRIFGIEPERFVLLLSSVNINQFHKGGDLVNEILSGIPELLKKKMLIVTMGGAGQKVTLDCGVEAIDYGFVSDENLKSSIYSLSDLFLFPSRGESFGLVALESLACGTPVVAFKVGGVPDMIEKGRSGHIADYGDVDSFRSGIVERMENAKLLEQESANAPAVVAEKFTIEQQANQYMELYSSLQA